MNHYSSDRPALSKDQDRFQRYGYAKRIADTIIDRKDDDCIVIGIYGTWGDGKTTVLNFIEKELCSSECISIRFNPWRYKGEDELLKQFFETLARELKADLLTKKEKKGSWLKKASPFAKPIKIPFVDVGELLNNIGSALSSLGVEKLKERISEILKVEQRKIVVFIDDIDRLNKDEIHAIFRLVKLNADFNNTTYILSFDEEMVAAAIGDRFGKGNVEAGRDFLEKIIQVRLTLPKVQREALKSFQFELINRVIDNNGFNIDNNNASKFIGEFDNLLLRLKTPRQAAQYANSISFSLPLLFGEVDISDLLLIEGIKIFYPKHYEFIKTSPHFFISGYYSSGIGGRKETRIKEIKQHFDDLGSDLSNKDREAVKELLIELFPKLKEAFENYSFGYEAYTEWSRNKQIASPGYFERYFSYCVIKGQLSDISFNELRDQLIDLDSDSIKYSVQKLIQESSSSAFIEKVRIHEDEYTWKEGCSLIRGIILNEDLLSPQANDQMKFWFETGRGQAVKFIYVFFEKYKKEINSAEKMAFAKEVLYSTQQYEFRFLILGEIGTRVIERMVFTFEELKEIHGYHRQLMFESAHGEPIYKLFPNEFFSMSEHWGEIDNPSLKDYVRETLNNSPENVIFLLKSFTVFVYSTDNPEGQYRDLNKQNFYWLERNFDLDFIKVKLNELFINEAIEEDAVWIGRDDIIQTDLNIARQFIYWCNQPKSNS